MTTLHRFAVALLATFAAGQAAAQCFMIFDRQQRLVYQSVDAPFDMSQPISRGLDRHYPGHHLVMTNSAANCTTVMPRASMPVPANGDGRWASQSPVLALASEETLGARLARSGDDADLLPSTPAGVRTTRDGLRLRPERRSPSAP